MGIAVIDFFTNLGFLNSLVYGMITGFVLAIVHFVFKVLMVLLVQSNIHLKFIELPFLGMYFKRLSNLVPVFHYSPYIDKVNVNVHDALNFDDDAWSNLNIENPLQIQDDNLINKLNAPFIYFNPKTNEVYGSFILMAGVGYQTKYFSAKLIEDEKVL